MKYHFSDEIYFELLTKCDLLDALHNNYDWVLKHWTPGEIEGLPEDVLWLAEGIEVWEDIADIIRPYLIDGEIAVRLDINGYYYPGCMYRSNGDPGDPPEGDEERIITAIIIGNKMFSDTQQPELFNRLADFLQTYIEDVPVEYPDA